MDPRCIWSSTTNTTTSPWSYRFRAFRMELYSCQHSLWICMAEDARIHPTLLLIMYSMRSKQITETLPLWFAKASPYSSSTLGLIWLNSNGFTAILVVIDPASKQGIFIPTYNTITSEQLAQLFILHVFSKHGVPNHVTSDCGSEFITKFMRALGQALNMEFHYTSGYHPEADGQTEQANQTLEWNIYCSYQQDNWSQLLLLTEFAYNNAPNASTGITPFFANKGYHPNITIYPEYDLASLKARELAVNLDELHSVLKCYVPCRSNTNNRQPMCFCSDSVGPPSATLGTPGMALHNLSWDTGDLLTSLSFLLNLLIFPMPRSDYIPHVFLMFSLIYFCSSSGSSINSSTIVGNTQTKNLVVFQFRLHANLSCFPYDSTNNVPSSHSSDSAACCCLTIFASEWPMDCRLPSEPISNLRPLSEIMAQGHRKRVT